MKRQILLILIMAVAAGVASCQPTPEKEVVVGKGEEQIEKMLDIAEGSMKKEKNNERNLGNSIYEVPNEINCIFESKGVGAEITVSVEAEVIVPEICSAPILSISPTNLSYEIVETFIESIAKDKKLYHQIFASQVLTVYELEDLIDRYMKKIALCTPEMKQQKEEYQQIINNLYKEMETAPKSYAECERSNLANIFGDEDAIYDENRMTLMDYKRPVIINIDNYDKSEYVLEVDESYYAPVIRIFATTNSKNQLLAYSTKLTSGALIKKVVDISVMNDFELGIDEALKIANEYANRINTSMSIS